MFLENTATFLKNRHVSKEHGSMFLKNMAGRFLRTWQDVSKEHGRMFLKNMFLKNTAACF